MISKNVPKKQKMAQQDEHDLTNKSFEEQKKIYFQKASKASSKKEYEDAIRLWTAYIDLIDNDPVAFFERGTAYWLSKQYYQAIRDLTTAICLKPNYSWA